MKLKERVVRELRDSITRGDYQPGEHLTEAALCERFKISRTPIREALGQLEKERLVKMVPAAGARVVEFSLQEGVDVYDLLIALEATACRLGCSHITDAEIGRLDEYNFYLEKAITAKNVDLIFEANFQFHWLITEATHNPYLIEVRSNYRRLMDRIMRVFTQEIPEQPNISVQDHGKIIGALKARNSALSEFLMREHLEGAKRRLIDYFQRAEKRPMKERARNASV